MFIQLQVDKKKILHCDIPPRLFIYQYLAFCPVLSFFEKNCDSDF